MRFRDRYKQTTDDCVCIKLAVLLSRFLTSALSLQQTNHSLKRIINKLNSVLTEFIFCLFLGGREPVNVGAIVGGVIGAILFLLIVVFLIIFGRKLYPTPRTRQRKEQQKEKVIVE